MQSYHDFGQAVSSKVMQKTADRVTVGGAEPVGETTESTFDPQIVADAMLSAWGKLNFGPLEEIVDR